MLNYLLLFVVIILVAIIVKTMMTYKIGGAPYRSQHIVVDTLNLTHWIHGGKITITPKLIISAIDKTAPFLRKKHNGRIMYVLKDRESQFTTPETKQLYKDIANKHSIYIIVAERYVDPPIGVPKTDQHSSRGRDDLLISILANRWRCSVLTEDRLHDFKEFRATIQPFYATEYTFWREFPHKEYIRPESISLLKLRKPRMLRYIDYFSDIGKK